MTDNCDMCRKNDWPCHLHGLMEGGAAKTLYGPSYRYELRKKATYSYCLDVCCGLTIVGRSLNYDL